jgi:hypothetical protein
VRADIVPGGTFPDYQLTDHTEAGDHSLPCPYRERNATPRSD